MKLLVIDGNSIVNRAYYGIKALATKDGQFTNGIYGFLNILLRLQAQCEPNAVAVAFDLKAPTFRHLMYDQYKAGRHGMPDELRSQMPILKELLVTLGYNIIEKEGYEADDILGTLSAQCKGDDHCYIATGDRDSLQLISDNATVLLAATKMGQAVTTVYNKEQLLEDYGLSPEGMIQLKAIMGDSSDNIPGVPGIGQKGATDLVQRFGTLDYIYENLDTIDIKKGVRSKLEAGKDSAYLSLKLGTICKEAPIDTDIAHYLIRPADVQKAIKTFVSLEMFGMIEKFGLSGENIVIEDSSETVEKTVLTFSEERDLPALLGRFTNEDEAYFTTIYNEKGISGFVFAFEKEVLLVSYDCPDFDWFTEKFFAHNCKKYTSDIKELYKYALNKDYELNNVVLDTTLAGYLLNPSSSDYSVKRLAQESSVPSPEISDIPDDINEEYKEAIENSALLKAISEKLLKKISDFEMDELLNNIELPLAKVLASMEKEGMLVSKQSIEEYGKELEEKIKLLKESIIGEVGHDFNLNSPKQLGTVLFEELNLPAKKKTKTGYSTNAEVLEELAGEFPIVSDILKYRTLAKLNSTYCEGLLKSIKEDGRIHSTLNQVETRTGRISSLEPNLQNIPVRTPEGAMMRKFFIAKEGYTLVDADYSQIELRVLAHIAKDKNMLDAFNNGDDIHAITASQVFNMPLMMVTPLMRSHAKAVNFGIVYGIGAFSLSKDIGVSMREASNYIKGYLHHYNGINSYMEKVVKEATADGYSKTVFNRRRYLPELSASNKMTRAFGERVARNMPIQGTAADIIKIAMIKVYNKLAQEYPDAKLLMQVHDELIVECKKEDAEAISAIVKAEMESAYKMSAPLLADVHTGETWYEAKS